MPKAPARALALYQKACDAALPDGCLTAAFIPTKGETGSRDDGLAAQHFEEACAKNHGLSCLWLSDLHAAGHGVTKDAARLAELLEKACTAGEKEACKAARTPPAGS